MTFLPIERETTVVFNEKEPVVRIWSASPKVIKQLREHGRFLEEKSELWDGHECVTFLIDRRDFFLARAGKRVMSDAERERRAGTLLGTTALAA